MAKYAKGDCRNNGGQIKTKASKYPKLVKGTVWFTGQNRHERRSEKARQKFTFKLRGVSGFKILRRMFREYGVKETALLINGANRGKRFHPGYAKLGAYTREGFKLATKKGAK